MANETNREIYELYAGMNLDDMFFRMNNIDPDAIYVEETTNNVSNKDEVL